MSESSVLAKSDVMDGTLPDLDETLERMLRSDTVIEWRSTGMIVISTYSAMPSLADRIKPPFELIHSWVDLERYRSYYAIRKSK